MPPRQAPQRPAPPSAPHLRSRQATDTPLCWMGRPPRPSPDRSNGSAAPPPHHTPPPAPQPWPTAPHPAPPRPRSVRQNRRSEPDPSWRSWRWTRGSNSAHGPRPAPTAPLPRRVAKNQSAPSQRDDHGADARIAATGPASPAAARFPTGPPGPGSSPSPPRNTACSASARSHSAQCQTAAAPEHRPHPPRRRSDAR